jgi:invasion protein IalB
MKTNRRHTRLRPLWVALCLGVLLAIVAASTSAPAAAARGNIVVVSASPRHPTAGQAWTVKVQVQRPDGTPAPLSQVQCNAAIGGRPVPVLIQRISADGTTATCSWSVPSGTTGRTIDGVIAMKRADTGRWYYLGFDEPIH